MSRTGATLVVIAAALLGACEVRSKLFCSKHPEDERCASDGDATTTACGSDGDCDVAAGTPRCELPEGTCVACLDNAGCANPSPTCDGTTHACRACAENGDCASDACLAGGTCADAAEVAYVGSGGGGTSCTQAAPCATALDGLTTGRRYVRMKGTTSTPRVTVVREVSFLGDPGTSVVQGTDSRTFSAGAGAKLELVGLTLTNAIAQGIGVEVTDASASVTLSRCTLQGHAGGAIAASQGTVTVLRSVIASNPGGGLLLIAATGAVKLTALNNFIFANGSATSTRGGIAITSAAGSVLQFNTIVGNHTDATNHPAGINCDNTTDTNNNIIVHNVAGPGSGATSNAGTGCTIGVSIADEFTETAFHDPAALTAAGFHLDTQSAAINRGSGSATDVDFDGQHRPDGNAPDVGADEF